MAQFSYSMDEMLTVAVGLCLCKLFFSLLCWSFVTTSINRVTFGSCCLLLFTDLVVTSFLVFLWAEDSWKPQPSRLSDVIAMRFLLFLSHTYGSVLLLTVPLVAIETILRLRWPQLNGCELSLEDSEGQGLRGGQVTQKEEERDTNPQSKRGDNRVGRWADALGFLSCLLMWTFSSLHGAWRWRLEELWTLACWQATDCLVACLPNVLTSLLPLDVLYTGWCLAALSLLLISMAGLAISRQHQPHPQWGTSTHKEQSGLNDVEGNTIPSKAASWGVSVWVSALPSVDLAMTKARCLAQGECSRNDMQLPHCCHGYLESPGNPAVWGGEHKATDPQLVFTSPSEAYNTDSRECGQPRWGFPCLRLDVITGVVGLLSVCVLPLNFSVNIFLIRAMEDMLDQGIRTLVTGGHIK